MNYYRLKILDVHNNYYYSDTISVAAPVERIIMLYPNPAREYVYLKLTDIEGEAEIKIVDINGGVVKKLKVTTGNADVPINISQLQRGTYSVSVLTTQLNETLQFIKQ
jgi:hypothetical protein